MEKSQALKEVIGDYDSFVSKLLEKLKGGGFNFEELKELDHLCYRVETFAEYEKIKSDLKPLAALGSENIVSGRPFAVFKLHKPIITNDWIIPALEVPAPKEGRSFKSGLEHVEFVVDSLDKVIGQHPDLDFDLKGLNRKNNPELALCFSDCTVKFHLKNILEITQIQRTTGQL